MSFDIIPILVFITIMRPASALQNLCQRLWVVYKKRKAYFISPETVDR